MARKDLTVFIGRFSPFHNGHAAVLERALQTSKVVLVLVGSAGDAPTIKNPFSYQFRSDLIWSWRKTLGQGKYGKLRISSLPDTPYNDQLWTRDVQVEVEAAKNAFVDELGLNPTIHLTGAKRDASGWYLDVFPTWQKDFFQDAEHDFSLSASKVRDILFTSSDHADVASRVGSLVPGVTLDALREFRTQPLFEQLRREHHFIESYKMRWQAAPYAPTFTTVDAVVVQAGHVLLIERRAEPGKGLWALPGGFVNQSERLQAAVLRELREETRLKVPEPVLKGSIKSKETFDHPDRSLRGRTITTAFLIQLAETGELPTVKGGDDAAKAFWVPIAEAMAKRDQFFEDHYSIIQTMIGRLDV
jgi:bifunctional NMN adenylyltransferase/nudix hydrolase